MDNSDSNFSPSDLDLLTRTVIGEAGNDPSASAVAHVVLNRLQSGKYGNSVPDVLFAPHQFEAWDNPQSANRMASVSPDSPQYQSAYKIVQAAVNGGEDPTRGAVQYYSPGAQAALGRAPPSWDNGSGVMIGSQKFFGGKEPDLIQQFMNAPQGAPASASSGTGTQAPQQPSAQPAAPQEPDLIQQFMNAPGSQSAPAQQPTNAPQGATAQQPSGIAEAASAANGPIRAVATGIPIFGGLLNRADAATDAALAPLLNRFYAPNDQLQGATFGQRYGNALNTQNSMDQSYAAAHPVVNALANVGGGILGTLPVMAAAPAAFGLSETAGLGTNALFSAGTGAGIGAADAGVRSDGDWNAIKSGTAIGGAFGLLGPIAGNAIGSGINALSNVVTRTGPGARYVANALQGAGMAPQDAANALVRMGPQATLADLDPALSAAARGIASTGGEPTSILAGAMQARAAGADDRMSQIVTDALGPKPDAPQVLAGIRYRESYGQVDPVLARSALDNAMGPAVDPYAQLQSMMAARTAASKPIYQEALSNPVIWDKRLQSFLDDPIVQSGLQKGVEIQRLESLANNEPFNPNDYVYKGKGVTNDPTTGQFTSAPIIGQAPNMKTLDVIKNGLDGIVQDAQDPITGKLSKYGVAVDKVRSAYVNKLDEINPDYAAARQAWAGPTVTHEAFNRGLNIFRNQTGSAGVNTTPGALSSWVAKASDGEKDAVKIGARTAFQQQMATAADPASKAAGLASLPANQQKLAAVLGPQEAQNLTKQLNFEYTDPVGQAFSKGMDIFRNRQGVQGVEDTPDALQSWLKTASPGEREAVQQGARQTIEQALSSARQGDLSAARSLFGKSTANREKLAAIFPGAQKMLDGLDNELKMRSTQQEITAGSKTAQSMAIQKTFSPKESNALSAAPAIIGDAVAGGGGAVAATALKTGWDKATNALQEAALNRLKLETAKGLVSTGPAQRAFMGQVGRAARTNALTNALARGGSTVANLLTRTGGNALANAYLPPPLTIHPRNYLDQSSP